MFSAFCYRPLKLLDNSKILVSLRNIQFQIFIFILFLKVKGHVTSNACLLLSYIVSGSGLATMGSDLVSFYPRFQLI